MGEALTSLEFKPWRRFSVFKDEAKIVAFMDRVGKDAVRVFRRGSAASGRRSQPGQFPARQSGALLASLDYIATADEMTVGTNVFYAVFLRNGTRKMARRAMSDNALREALAKNNGELKGWVKWRRS